MATFLDRNGRGWTITLNIGTLRRIHHATGVDLLKAMDTPETLHRLAEEWETLVNVVWLCVAEQAAADNITDEQFGESLDGESLDQATRALLEALINFVPEKRRAILRKIAEKSQAMETRMLAEVEAAIDSGAIEAALTRGS